jgi:hypothetical protein
MEFFQWGTQYTFHKSSERKMSMAVGFRNILETQDPEQTSNDFTLKTAAYNPLLIFAKNWNDRYFIMFSGGVQITQEIEERQMDHSFPLTTAFHYNFPESDHYVGVEFNKEIEDCAFEMFIRPQVILQVFDDFILGVSFGVPVGIQDVKWTGFLRLAYEFR